MNVNDIYYGVRANLAEKTDKIEEKLKNHEDTVLKKNEARYQKIVGPYEKRLNDKYNLKISDSKKYKKGKRKNKKGIIKPYIAAKLALIKLNLINKKYEKLKKTLEENKDYLKSISNSVEGRKIGIGKSVIHVLGSLGDSENKNTVLYNWGKQIKSAKRKKWWGVHVLNGIIGVPLPIWKTIRGTSNRLKNKVPDKIINDETNEINEQTLINMNPTKLASILASDEVKYSPEEGNQVQPNVAENKESGKGDDYEKFLPNKLSQEPNVEEKTENYADNEPKIELKETEAKEPVIEESEVITEEPVVREESKEEKDGNVISSVDVLLRGLNNDEARKAIEKYASEEYAITTASKSEEEPAVEEVTDNKEEEPIITITPEESKVEKTTEPKEDEFISSLNRLTNQMKKLYEDYLGVQEKMKELTEKNEKIRRKNKC